MSDMQGTSAPIMVKGTRGHTVRRLVGYLMASKVRVIVMMVSGIAGVALIVAGPKVLGQATNVLFAGLLGTMLAQSGPRTR